MHLWWNTREDIFFFPPPGWQQQLTGKIRLLFWFYETSGDLTWNPSSCVKGKKGKNQRETFPFTTLCQLHKDAGVPDPCGCPRSPQCQWSASISFINSTTYSLSKVECLHHPPAREPGEWQALPQARRNSTDSSKKWLVPNQIGKVHYEPEPSCCAKR